MLIQRYRNIIAYFMSIWFMMVVISGAVFTHKEVTSTGEIIIHNHPYDFTAKKKHQHHTDDEIHFLDVVFCNIYTPTGFITFEPVIRPVFQGEYCDLFHVGTFTVELSTQYLRGPPVYC